MTRAQAVLIPGPWRWRTQDPVPDPDPVLAQADNPWAHTDRLKVTGDGHRDRLVAARLNLRRHHDE